MKNFTILLVLLSAVVSAQKNNPVAGQAARLVDLLKKDYNAVTIMERNETISKDMDEVIATLMVYSEEKDNTAFIKSSTSTQASLTEYQQALDRYANLNKSITGLNISSSTSKGQAFDTIAGISEGITKTKSAYYKAKINYNMDILVELSDQFQNSNAYLQYMSNLFISKYANVKSLDFDAFAQANYTSSIQKAMPFFGGDLAFSEAIDGLSRFLAKRIKDELTVYAVEKIQEYLRNPKPESYLNELMVLLPTTTSYLKSFDSSRTLNFVDDLKQYIENDLNNLIANASGLKNTPRFKKYIEEHPDLDFAFEALELFPQLSKMENPIDYFDMLENSRNIQRWSSYSNLHQQVSTVELADKYANYIAEQQYNKKNPEKKSNKAEIELDEAIKKSKFLNDYQDFAKSVKHFRKSEMTDYLNDEKKIKNSVESLKLSKLKGITDINNKYPGFAPILDDDFKGKLKNALDEFKLNSQIIAEKKAIIFTAITALSDEKASISKINEAKLRILITDIVKNYNFRNFDILFNEFHVLNEMDSNQRTSNISTVNTQIDNIVQAYAAILNLTYPELKTFIDEDKLQKQGYTSFPYALGSQVNKYDYKTIITAEIQSAEKQIENIPDIKLKEKLHAYFEIAGKFDFTDNDINTAATLQTGAAEIKKLKLTKKDIQYNIANSIKLASMLAHSLMIVEDSKPKFANTAFMSGYSSEVNFYLLYIGFLQQQNRKYYNISFYLNSENKQLDFSPLMKNFPAEKVIQKATEFQAVAGSLTRIAENAEKLHNSLLKIKKANSSGEKVAAEEIHDLAGDIIDFSEDVFFAADTLLNTPSLRMLQDADISPILKKTAPYITTARTVNDIFLDLHTKNYTTAMIKAIEIPSAFGKNNDESQLYASILNITNDLGNIQKAANLKNLFAYSRVYTDNEKNETQKNLANWIKISFDSDPKMTDYRTKFDNVYKVIYGGTGNLTAELEELKDKINNPEFYTKYFDIDTYKISNRIGSYLTEKGLEATAVSNISTNISSVITKSISAYIFDDAENRKALADQKKILVLNLKYHLPEMFPDIFQFTDENTVKLIHFVNDVANANNAEDVEKALNTFALPPGSSSLKEQTKSYFSINAYPGLFGGYTSTSITKGDSYNVGFTAPVGIYGQICATDIGTVGLFLPLIDIAAPVRLRLGDNTENLPDLEFKDVFSPGLFVSYGFNKSPFAINLGGQFGPSLKSISDGSGSETGENQKVVEKQAFYWSIAFTIDIPLFTIHAKSKN